MFPLGVIGNTPDFGSGILGSNPGEEAWRWRTCQTGPVTSALTVVTGTCLG